MTTGRDFQPSRVHVPRAQDIIRLQNNPQLVVHVILGIAFGEESPEVDSKIRSTVGAVVLLETLVTPENVLIPSMGLLQLDILACASNAK